MKSLITLVLAALLAIPVFAQIRIIEVNPITDQFTIKNFGTSTVDVSAYRACARFSYSALSGFGIVSGSLNLAPDAELELVSAGYLNDVSSDLGLYLAAGSFSSPSAMVDFVQYGGSGIGRESVAAAKGIWTAGTFINGPVPFSYTCSGDQPGVGAWVTDGTEFSTELSAADCGTTVANLTDYIRANALSGTSRYMWQVDGGGTADTAYSPLSNPSSRKMAMSFFDNVQYNTTYNVRLKVYRNGCWGDWGDACTVTTPPAAPTTQLSGADCGTTVSSNFQYLRYDYVPGATRYRLWATSGGSYSDTIYTPVYAPTIRKFFMAQFPGYALSTTYDIRVSALVGGVWTAFGPSCSVTTAASKTDDRSIVTSTEAAGTLLAFPNPSAGAITLALPGLEPGSHDIDINVFDMTGRRVWNRRLVGTDGEMLGQLNADGDFASGMYLLVARIDGTTYQQKLVIR